jgi:hypothetical protein
LPPRGPHDRPENARIICRNRKEMRATLPLHTPLIDQLQVRLVDERGGRQRVVGPLSAEVATGQPAQFAVHSLDQTAAGRDFTVAPGKE